MDLITSFIQPCLSRAGDTLVRHIGYLKTKTIIKELAEAMRDLEAKRNDIQMEIETAVRDRKQCTQQVQRWLEKISETEGNITAIQSDYEGSRCNLFGAHIPNCWSSYRTGRRASKMLVKVIDLEKEPADFGAISMPHPPVRVKEFNPNTAFEEGTMMASYLEMVRHYLEEEDGYVIGIWGMGGVGKTTLLQAINNVYLHHSAVAGTKFFDHVIFVVVSKDHSLEKLQKDTIKCLGLSSSDDVESQATFIFDFLKEKNFLLLLDDAWEAVDLKAIGIPNPIHASNNTDNRQRRKVVVTTRSEEVCGRMDSRMRIKVECLRNEEAWNLFKEKVGKDLLDSYPDLVSPAQEVAKECGGLPLALIVIGRTMSTKRSSEAWNYAITQLRKSQPNNIPGMEDSLFPTLKFSYDSLNDDRMRGCFLCCSLWPEDYEIGKDDLIVAWMGLGLIDDFDDINEAYDLGYFVIESLIAASLLESVEDDDRKVKMHDVIRDLALWIACDCGKERNRWLVKANAGLKHVSSDVATKWGEAERVSLMQNFNLELPWNPLTASCPNLSALFLQWNELKEIPVGFLRCMPNLTYLDLSGNRSLREIPNEIGCLVQLRYLNLSATNILSLPDELGQLQNLKYLLLGYTYVPPVNIPIRVFSSLSKLEFLDLYPRTELCSYDDDDDDDVDLKSLLSGLKALGVKIKSFKNLQQLSHHQVPIIRLRMEDMGDSPSFHLHQYFNSVTQGCLRELTFEGCQSLSEVVMDIGTLPRLENLELIGLESMREIVWRRNVVPSECFRRLRSLTISKCSLLRNITWILHLPLLEHLEVIYCDAMEQLVGEQVDGASTLILAEETPRQGQINCTVTFPCLKTLHLDELPRLCDICCSDYALLNFPSLAYVVVQGCPELKKFPFRPQVNCNKLRRIEGSPIWWDSIEWEDEGIKSSLQSFTDLRY